MSVYKPVVCSGVMFLFSSLCLQHGLCSCLPVDCPHEMAWERAVFVFDLWTCQSTHLLLICWLGSHCRKERQSNCRQSQINVQTDRIVIQLNGTFLKGDCLLPLSHSLFCPVMLTRFPPLGQTLSWKTQTDLVFTFYEFPACSRYGFRKQLIVWNNL